MRCQLQARLERRIAELAAIADWKDDLESRIHRAHLIFELVDCDHDFSDLEAEVAAFKQVCLGLSGEKPVAMAKAA